MLLGRLNRLDLVLVQLCLVRAIQQQLLDILSSQHEVGDVEGQDGRLGCELLGVEDKSGSFGVDDDVAVDIAVSALDGRQTDEWI